MTFDLTDWDASRYTGPIKPRWSPQCPVCGDPLGRDVTLDVLDTRDGGRFRLACMRRDPAHAVDVSRYYELAADYAPGVTIEHVAMKTWADPGKVAATVAAWVFANRLIQPVSERRSTREE